MRGLKHLAAVATAAVALATLPAAPALADNHESAEMDRIGDHPNLNGVWQVMNSARPSIAASRAPKSDEPRMYSGTFVPAPGTAATPGMRDSPRRNACSTTATT